MGFFSSTQRTLSLSRSIIYDELYFADFLSEPGYYWTGFGSLVAYSHTWLGAGQLVNRSAIPDGFNDEAGDLTLTMSGLDGDMLARLRASEQEMRGRDLMVWGQFFNEALQPTDSRFLLFRGFMDVPTYSWNEDQATMSIACEGEFSDRVSSQFSYFSDKDQLKRFPADKGLEYVYRYTAATKRAWPHFA